MCQGFTKDGKPCRRKAEPYCKDHGPEPTSQANLDALTALIDGLRARDALLAPEPVVRLGLTLAADMDSGEDVLCVKCKTPVRVTRNAALVKQYREVIEVLASDDSADDDADLWEDFHAAGRGS